MISVDDFDYDASTAVCKAMDKYGSDKGDRRRHNYTVAYDKLFRDRFNAPLRIFEMGLGTNNPTLASSMGVNGKPGASLYAWRELFPKSSIFGADIDRDILFESERIKTFYCDQTSEPVITDMWLNQDLLGDFDIIVDDGLHVFQANTIFFDSSIHKLKKGGYYIIEDIRQEDRPKFKTAIKLWKNLYPHLTFSPLALPLQANDYDNYLLVIHYPEAISGGSQEKYLELSKRASTGNRNLVYFCVFFNREYFKLADLLLKSIKFFSETAMQTVDFLIITSEEFKADVFALCNSTGIFVNIFVVPLETMFQAACARLHIFDYVGLAQYDTLLYLDTDILVKGDLQKIFDLPIKERLHGIESGTIQSPSFGAQFFGGSADPSVKGFNSGTLLFKNCLKIRDLFSRIRGHCDAHTDSKAAVPYCMDQPFINYHAIKGSIHNNTLLNPYVSLFEGYDEVKNERGSIICHFSYPIGNAGHKLGRMGNYFAKMLETEREMVGAIGGGAELAVPSGKRYSWGTGWIQFSETELLTTWAKGTYKSLGRNWFCVDWSNHRHIIRMNADFTEYTGLRIWPNDFTVCEGLVLKN